MENCILVCKTDTHIMMIFSVDKVEKITSNECENHIHLNLQSSFKLIKWRSGYSIWRV